MARVPIEAMNGHGQSLDATIDKERCIGSALRVAFALANAANENYRRFSGRDATYWHCDTNAGCGHNDIVDLPGSPVVFHDTGDKYLRMKRQAFFCDYKPRTIAELSSRLRPEWAATSHLLSCDNEKAVEIFAQHILQSGERPDKAVGTILSDPNGYYYRTKDGEGVPINSLPIFTRKFLRIDVILNLNLSAYWKQRAHYPMLSPYDVLALLNKKFWLVRRTVIGSGNRWLLAIGRNIATSDHRKIGFYHLNSPEGRDVMIRAEGKRQNELHLMAKGNDHGSDSDRP